MIMKWLKRSVIVVAGVSLVGGMLFGKDVVSYVRSSAKSVQTVVKDSVPIELELRRARDLLEDIIPEMHANVRLIAQEEVEVAALKGEIEKNQDSIKDEETKVKTLRGGMEEPRAESAFAGRNYSHNEVKQDLAMSIERLKGGEVA